MGASLSTGSCSVCGAPVAADDLYCHHCGGQVAQTAGAGATVANVGPLLAQANLLRMRGAWDEAEARCVESMRADPNNVHAHSLLGDIFRDQARYDDAAQWYQLALDLKPDSAADRAKLLSVEEQRSRQQGTLPGIVAGAGTQKLAGLPPAAWIRGLWALVVVFLVAVAAVLLTRPRSPASRPFLTTGTVRAAPGAPGQPRGFPEQAATAPAGLGPGHAAAAAPPAGSEPGIVAVDPMMLAVREADVTQAVSRQLAGSAGFSLAAVILDPRGDQATMSLLYTPAAGSAGVPEEQLVRGVVDAVSAAFNTDAAMERLSVSVRANTPTGRAVPIFAGDIDRAAAQAAFPNATPQQALSAFSRVWRSPDALPASSAPTGPRTVP